MPTTPPESLYSPDLIVEGTRATRERYEPVIKEIIHYGVSAVDTALRWDPKAVDDAKLSCISLYYQVLETFDTTLVLLRQACAIGMRLALRSAFEGILGLEYMLREDSARRGRSYLVADAHTRIAVYLLVDINTPEGRDFQKRLSKDEFTGGGLSGFEFKDFAAQRANLERGLRNDSLREIEREYQRVKKKFKQRPKWYALYGGPRDLRQLAHRLGKSATYDVLYRQWSDTAHLTDLKRHMGTESGQLKVVGLRDARGLTSVSGLATTFGVTATRIFLQGILPDRISSGEFKRWYTQEIRHAIPGLPGIPR